MKPVSLKFTLDKTLAMNTAMMTLLSGAGFFILTYIFQKVKGSKRRKRQEEKRELIAEMLRKGLLLDKPCNNTDSTSLGLSSSGSCVDIVRSTLGRWMGYGSTKYAVKQNRGRNQPAANTNGNKFNSRPSRGMSQRQGNCGTYRRSSNYGRPSVKRGDTSENSKSEDIIINHLSRSSMQHRSIESVTPQRLCAKRKQKSPNRISEFETTNFDFPSKSSKNSLELMKQLFAENLCAQVVQEYPFIVPYLRENIQTRFIDPCNPKSASKMKEPQQIAKSPPLKKRPTIYQQTKRTRTFQSPHSSNSSLIGPSSKKKSQRSINSQANYNKHNAESSVFVHKKLVHTVRPTAVSASSLNTESSERNNLQPTIIQSKDSKNLSKLFEAFGNDLQVLNNQNYAQNNVTQRNTSLRNTKPTVVLPVPPFDSNPILRSGSMDSSLGESDTQREVITEDPIETRSLWKGNATTEGVPDPDKTLTTSLSAQFSINLQKPITQVFNAHVSNSRETFNTIPDHNLRPSPKRDIITTKKVRSSRSSTEERESSKLVSISHEVLNLASLQSQSPPGRDTGFRQKTPKINLDVDDTLFLPNNMNDYIVFEKEDIHDEHSITTVDIDNQESSYIKRYSQRDPVSPSRLLKKESDCSKISSSSPQFLNQNDHQLRTSLLETYISPRFTPAKSNSQSLMSNYPNSNMRKNELGHQNGKNSKLSLCSNVSSPEKKHRIANLLEWQKLNTEHTTPTKIRNGKVLQKHQNKVIASFPNQSIKSKVNSNINDCMKGSNNSTSKADNIKSTKHSSKENNKIYSRARVSSCPVTGYKVTPIQESSERKLYNSKKKNAKRSKATKDKNSIVTKGIPVFTPRCKSQNLKDELPSSKCTTHQKIIKTEPKTFTSKYRNEQRKAISPPRLRTTPSRKESPVHASKNNSHSPTVSLHLPDILTPGQTAIDTEPPSAVILYSDHTHSQLTKEAHVDHHAFRKTEKEVYMIHNDIPMSKIPAKSNIGSCKTPDPYAKSLELSAEGEMGLQNEEMSPLSVLLSTCGNSSPKKYVHFGDLPTQASTSVPLLNPSHKVDESDKSSQEILQSCSSNDNNENKKHVDLVASPRNTQIHSYKNITLKDQNKPLQLKSIIDRNQSVKADKSNVKKNNIEDSVTTKPVSKETISNDQSPVDTTDSLPNSETNPNTLDLSIKTNKGMCKEDTIKRKVDSIDSACQDDAVSTPDIEMQYIATTRVKKNELESKVKPSEQPQAVRASLSDNDLETKLTVSKTPFCDGSVNSYLHGFNDKDAGQSDIVMRCLTITKVKKKDLLTKVKPYEQPQTVRTSLSNNVLETKTTVPDTIFLQKIKNIDTGITITPSNKQLVRSISNIDFKKDVEKSKMFVYKTNLAAKSQNVHLTILNSNICFNQDMDEKRNFSPRILETKLNDKEINKDLNNKLARTKSISRLPKECARNKKRAFESKSCHLNSNSNIELGKVVNNDSSLQSNKNTVKVKDNRTLLKNNASNFNQKICSKAVWLPKPMKTSKTTISDINICSNGLNGNENYENQHQCQNYKRNRKLTVTSKICHLGFNNDTKFGKVVNKVPNMPPNERTTKDNRTHLKNNVTNSNQKISSKAVWLPKKIKTSRTTPSDINICSNGVNRIENYENQNQCLEKTKGLRRKCLCSPNTKIPPSSNSLIDIVPGGKIKPLRSRTPENTKTKQLSVKNLTFRSVTDMQRFMKDKNSNFEKTISNGRIELPVENKRIDANDDNKTDTIDENDEKFFMVGSRNRNRLNKTFVRDQVKVDSQRPPSGRKLRIKPIRNEMFTESCSKRQLRLPKRDVYYNKSFVKRKTTSAALVSVDSSSSDHPIKGNMTVSLEVKDSKKTAKKNIPSTFKSFIKNKSTKPKLKGDGCHYTTIGKDNSNICSESTYTSTFGILKSSAKPVWGVCFQGSDKSFIIESESPVVQNRQSPESLQQENPSTKSETLHTESTDVHTDICDGAKTDTKSIEIPFVNIEVISEECSRSNLSEDKTKEANSNTDSGIELLSSSKININQTTKENNQAVRG